MNQEFVVLKQLGRGGNGLVVEVVRLQNSTSLTGSGSANSKSDSNSKPKDPKSTPNLNFQNKFTSSSSLPTRLALKIVSVNSPRHFRRALQESRVQRYLESHKFKTVRSFGCEIVIET